MQTFLESYTSNLDTAHDREKVATGDALKAKEDDLKLAVANLRDRRQELIKRHKENKQRIDGQIEAAKNNINNTRHHRRSATA